MIKYHYILIDYGVVQKKIQGDHTDGVLIKDKKSLNLLKPEITSENNVGYN